MTTETLTENNNFRERNTPETSAISEELRAKLKRFLTRDQLIARTKQGDIIGDVKDLIPRSRLDEHFNLVISRQTLDGDTRLYLLNSKYITRIDPKARSLFTTFDRAESAQLPEYNSSDTGSEDIASDRAALLNPSGETILNSSSHVSSDLMESSMVDANPIDANSTESNSIDSRLAEPVLMDQPILPDVTSTDSSSSERRVVSQQTIQLLQERLLIDRTKRKAGEIIVRKRIETRMVEVPVRREKLIVEQVGSTDKPLAEIDIGTGEITGIDFTTLDDLSNEPVVSSTFQSLATVAQLLDVVEKTIHYKTRKVILHLFFGTSDIQETYHEFPSPGLAATVVGAIATSLSYSCRKVQVKIILENEEAQPIYQKWFDYYSQL
jgi:stress response protein YsnF